MIVVDVNIVAYLFIDGDHTEAVERVLRADQEWAAPLLWRSEWLNVLSGYIRRGELGGFDARARFREAEAVLRGREFLPDGERVLELAGDSGCSAYDCEYVAVAEALDVPLVTADRRVLESFAELARSPERFAGTR